MSDWEEKIIAVLHANTNDLKELAQIAGADPKSFYRGANFRDADLRGQDLSEIDLTGARMEKALIDSLQFGDEIRLLQAKIAAHGERDLEWAKLNYELGIALFNQGIHTEGAAGAELLAQAVTAYENALEVYTRMDHPVAWAATQNNLGNALRHQGVRTEGAAGANLLAQAVTAYENALEVRTRADHPVDWALTQENMALAELTIAARSEGAVAKTHLQAALDHVENALQVYDPVHMSYNHARATRLRDGILERLAQTED